MANAFHNNDSLFVKFTIFWVFVFNLWAFFSIFFLGLGCWDLVGWLGDEARSLKSALLC